MSSGRADRGATWIAGSADTIRARQEGREPTALESDFPTVHDGARGVFFIEKVVESSQSTQKWLPARWVP